MYRLHSFCQSGNSFKVALMLGCLRAPWSAVFVDYMSGATKAKATDKECDQLLRHALARLLLSARAYHRVLRVARTIANLAGEAAIRAAHIAEAIPYRRLNTSF